MTVGFNTIFKKTSNINFTIRNTSILHKTIVVFGSKIDYNASLDLMSIPEVSEADIRHSLIKGELYNKIKNNDIRIISATIDLSQFDDSQKQFLLDAGLTNGYSPITSKILWASDGSGDAKTWQEVMNFVNNSKCPIDIYVKNNETIPFGTYDLKNSKITRGSLGDPNGIYINIEDGTILKNMFGIIGALTLISNSTSVVPLQFDVSPASPAIFVCQLSASLLNLGSVPMLQSNDGEFIVLAFIENGGINSSLTYPILGLGSSSIGLISVFSGSTLANNYVIGPSDAILAYQHDGSMRMPFQSNSDFDGTTLNVPFGTIGGSGNSSLRPIGVFGPMSVGVLYFDTSLTPPKIISWDGSQWVDALGTII